MKSVGETARKNIEAWWHIGEMRVDKHMADREKELRRALEHALAVYGALGRPDVTKAVHIALGPLDTFERSSGRCLRVT